jgi:hypothetical protein
MRICGAGPLLSHANQPCAYADGSAHPIPGQIDVGRHCTLCSPPADIISWSDNIPRVPNSPDVALAEIWSELVDFSSSDERKLPNFVSGYADLTMPLSPFPT